MEKKEKEYILTFIWMINYKSSSSSGKGTACAAAISA